MSSPAVVLAHGLYRTNNGKTAHGLVRGSERFAVRAVVDPSCAGEDAGVLLDGRHRGIPVVAELDAALALPGTPPGWCVVGVATHGGRLTPELRTALLAAARAGLSIANGLHDPVSDDAQIVAAARDTGAEIVDLRRPLPKSRLHFWEGEEAGVRTPRVAVLGTDCACGKRTTTRMLTRALVSAGVRAEMIYTGQTGWMQGARYGVVFDSIVNDYVSGELEHAIVTCEREAAPDVMVIEGQSSLRNPSGPCGAEFLLSAGARAVVLQHAPAREFYEGYAARGYRIPSLESEIELIGLYGARVIAVTLSDEGADEAGMRAHHRTLARALEVPVLRPLVDGVDALVAPVCAFMSEAGEP